MAIHTWVSCILEKVIFCAVFFCWILSDKQASSIEESHDHWNKESSQREGNHSVYRVYVNTSEPEVVIQQGDTAFLKCLAWNLGKQSVSWFRKSDYHILTSGFDIYTNDYRFQVLHPNDGHEWILQIKYVQTKDEGVYECQVSTDDGIVTSAVKLLVVTPEATIMGMPEIHVDKGSQINIICTIDKTLVPPKFVLWYHNNGMINYNSVRGGIEIKTDPGVKTQSQLIIDNASYADSGNYTCTATNAKSASVIVNVSEEEKTAAILRKVSNDSCIQCETIFIFVTFLRVLLFSLE